MFPGATADRDTARYVVVGAPLDISTSFQPGTRFGPDRVRRFSETYDDYDHTTDSFFSELSVHDAGDVHAWDDARDYLDHLAAELRAAVWDDAIPITIGGEHTVSLGGVEAVDPDVFVCIDAHLDLRDDYDGNELSHACVSRRALETADEAIVLGARTGSPEEYERAAAEDVTVVPPAAVSEWLSASPSFDDRSVYLSVDIDGADPGFAPGTGTMEPFGLTPRELRDVVRRVAPACEGFDVVEVNDRDHGEAAALAGKLLRTFVYHHAADR
ncbi:MAG: agmatinase [Halobacteriota archaeon]